MPNFGIAIGWNADAGDVEDFVPYQPLTPGLQYTRRTPTAASHEDEAPFIRFVFGVMSEAEYQAMLTQAGVSTLDEVEVTIRAQDENYTWDYFNGRAVKPRNEGRKGFHLTNVPLLITGIHLATTV